jgi:hypothetical protein
MDESGMDMLRCEESLVPARSTSGIKVEYREPVMITLSNRLVQPGFF